VRADGNEYGLPVGQVVEVAEGFELYPTPSAHPAVRGVTSMRNRLIPLVNLSWLLTDKAPDSCASELVVLVRAGETLLALQVDDAEGVSSEAPRPVPEAWHLPWSAGVADRGETLIPIVDVQLLVERLAPAEARTQS
jgi:two-component system chemotaxis response regulator CheV